MNINNKFEPVSISAKVRERLEKRANGLSTDVATNQTNPTEKHANLGKNLATPENIKDEFLNLLLSPKNDLPAPPKPALNNSATYHTDSSEICGTETFFLPQKKCEERKNLLTEKSNFSFTIESEALGNLDLSGQFDGVQMKVSLKLADSIDTQQLEVLEKMLQRQLCSTLGVQVELTIDRIPFNQQQHGQPGQSSPNTGRS